MSKWCHIVAGVCDLMVEAATMPTVTFRGGHWVQAAGGAAPGWRWDGAQWLEPLPDAQVLRITPRDFLRRFTATERETLEDLATNGGPAARKKLAAFKFYLSTGGYVELDDDYIVTAVAAMEAAGVIAAGRAAEILS